MNLNDILSALVRESGREILRERGRLLGLVADRHSAAKREQRLLKVAYEAGVVEDLLRDSGEHSQRRAVKKLAEDFVIESEAAHAVVAALCEALGDAAAELHSNPNKLKPNQAEALKTPQVIQPKPTPIGGRYQDNGDGTVTDVQTGLQWMRCVLGQTWDGKSCVGDPARFTWSGAQEAARALNQSGGYAGYQDWRVPDIEELKSLVVKGSAPTIDVLAFPGTPATFFWSSSPQAIYSIFSDHAWYLYFGHGYADIAERFLNCYLVRLVRS